MTKDEETQVAYNLHLSCNETFDEFKQHRRDLTKEYQLHEMNDITLHDTIEKMNHIGRSGTDTYAINWLIHTKPFLDSAQTKEDLYDVYKYFTNEGFIHAEYGVGFDDFEIDVLDYNNPHDVLRSYLRHLDQNATSILKNTGFFVTDESFFEVCCKVYNLLFQKRCPITLADFLTGLTRSKEQYDLAKDERLGCIAFCSMCAETKEWKELPRFGERFNPIIRITLQNLLEVQEDTENPYGFKRMFPAFSEEGPDFFFG